MPPSTQDIAIEPHDFSMIEAPATDVANASLMTMNESGHSVPVTIIVPQRGWVPLNLAEIWRYRDLLAQMVWRDFTTKYRQSVLGVTWAVLNPLVTMVIYTLVFGRLAKLPSEGVPYPIFSFAGLLPWMYFSGCLNRCSSSAVGVGGLLNKVYFPRLILPLSKVLNGLIDFAIQFVMLLLMMVWYRTSPTWGVVFLPLFLVMCMVSALSVGLWATALGVKYRDVQQLIGYVAQMWMWLTPVAYSANLVPEKYRLLYWMNPMVGVLEGFRWAMLGNSPPNWTMMAISGTVTSALFVGGLYFFRRTEATFADVI